MTQPSKSTLQLWRERFDELDYCPWPGPRPLRKGDPEAWLVGRHETRQEFRRTMHPHRLVLLYGLSGVGKTSLLRAGLIPDLERNGSTVHFADKWGGGYTTDVGTFLAEKLRLGTDAGAFEDLDSTFKDKGVIVLDQFEELVRYRPDTASKVIDFILDLNRRLSIKIVVSFRSEYLHELAQLGHRAVLYSSVEYALSEVDDSAAEKALLSGNKVTPESIDVETARTLAENWQAAREHARQEAAPDDPFGRVGLLHLQAMIYALYFANGGQPLTSVSVLGPGSPEERQAGEPGRGADAGAFRVALQRAVDFKLIHCEQAARELVGADLVDGSLTVGARWALARSVGHLSSAGYKLIRGAHELATLAMGVDYESLRDGLARNHSPLTHEQEQALFEAVFAAAHVGEPTDDAEAMTSGDLLDVGRDVLATRADELDNTARQPQDCWSFRIDDGEATSFVNDPGEVTCGPMMGLTAADVLMEEFRRFAFALVWLDASALVRVTRPMGGAAMVSLIHDGFGPALVRWTERVGGRPEGPLSAITAPRGASFMWAPGPALISEARPPTLSGDEDGPRLLVNLRWVGGSVQADFDRVAFVNCDLRGSAFLACRFSGVTFVNCLLDGAIFSDCIFAGEQADVSHQAGWSEVEPDFVIPAPMSLVESHARQRRGLERPWQAALLSPLSGAPAVPFRGEPSAQMVRFADKDRPTEQRRLLVRFDPGGVAIYGGRISTLVMRNCYFDEGGGLSLRHTTGSGLELVEVRDSPGRLEIFGSAVRHISVSPRVGESARARIDVRASQSALAQIWVGPRLTGTFAVTDSRLVHAWNGSPANGLEPGVDFYVAGDSVYHGLLDVTVKGGAPIGSGLQREDGAELWTQGFGDQLHRMDYRRNPAQLHHHQPAGS